MRMMGLICTLVLSVYSLVQILRQRRWQQISPIIAKLKGKSGVLHLEYYENDSNVITFSEEEADESSEDDTTSEDDATLEDDTTSEDSPDDSYGTSDFMELIMENML